VVLRNFFNLRRLIILAPRPQHHIRGGCPGPDRPFIRVVSLVRRLCEREDGGRDTEDVATTVRSQGAEKALTGLFGQVRFLEDALCGVYVREIHDGAGVARVEDGGQADARLQGLDDEFVDLVVDDVARASKVDRVDDFVVTVFFVAVAVSSLAAMTYPRYKAISALLLIPFHSRSWNLPE
jgi:hypothetical protein